MGGSRDAYSILRSRWWRRLTLYGGVALDANPDERAWVTPQTVYESIPEDQPLWRRRFLNIVGRSMPAQLLTKQEIFDFALNAYAKKYLPQFFYQLTTFYQASQIWLLEGDLRNIQSVIPDEAPAFWRVSATGCFYFETTNEADPCLNKYHLQRDTYQYFGYSPFVHKAVPYPGPCKQDRVLHEVAQRKPIFNLNDNDAWRGTDGRGGSTTYCLGGGVDAETTILEVTEGGQIFVSLPDLPFGVPEPPLLVGIVTDFGPPGPPGPQGPRGAPGQDGEPIEVVSAVCSLPEKDKDVLKECLYPGGVPFDADALYAVVLGAPNVILRGIGNTFIKKVPDVVLPRTELITTPDVQPELTATAGAETGWDLKLALPLAVLLALEYLKTKIQVFDCGPDGQSTFKYVDFPILSFQGISQREVYQELFRQLSMLMLCCKPCQRQDWVLKGRYSGHQEFRSVGAFQAVRLVRAPGDQLGLNRWYGDMTVAKLGNLRWIYADGTAGQYQNFEVRNSELHFWNSDDGEFHVPGAIVTGFEITTEWDFDYFVYYLPLFKSETGPWL